MSTFDPGLEPPGDWQTPYAPPPQQPNVSGGRAAVYLWLSAGLQLAVSGCCGLLGAGFMLLSADQISESLPADIPNRAEAMQMMPYVGPTLMIGSVVLLFIPALILAILGFWVRSGGRVATIMSLVILGIQTAGLALMTLNYIFILRTYPSAIILMFIVFMTGILVLFIKTCFELIGVLRQRGPAYPSEASW